MHIYAVFEAKSMKKFSSGTSATVLSADIRSPFKVKVVKFQSSSFLQKDSVKAP